MSCFNDFHDLSEAERLALCRELGRLTRIVPLSLSPTTVDHADPYAGEAVAGDSSTRGPTA